MKSKRTLLTERETTILSLIANGNRGYEISDTLKISESTVRFHTKNILNKLKATNSAQAVAIAIKNGLVGTAE